jgi:hypothetical protein
VLADIAVQRPGGVRDASNDRVGVSVEGWGSQCSLLAQGSAIDSRQTPLRKAEYILHAV